jgi:ATP10 protein
MSTRRFLMLSVVLVAAMVCAGGRAQTIPKSQGTTLAGTAVVLPDALKGKAGVLVVGFSHASQGQVATWTRLLEADYGKSNDVAYFALPMLAGAPKMLRGMIKKSMASSVPFAERPHFLPVTEGEPAWRATAHYDKPDDAYVLLVDNTGTVHWQTEGEATDMAYAEMKKNLRVMTAQVFVP